MDKCTSHHMHTLPIEDIIKHNHTTYSLKFQKRFDAQPGQFVNIWLPGYGDKPFSVSQLTDDHLEVTIKAVGAYTKQLEQCSKGDFIGVRGPFGNGFSLASKSLLVAGGIGIAPIRFLAHQLLFQQHTFTFIAGARTKQELCFIQEHEALHAIHCTDDGSYGQTGFVTEQVIRTCQQEDIETIYACGPEPMLIALREIANKQGCKCELAFERYMKCGIGICGSCCMDGSGIRLCTEGPILHEDQLKYITELGKPHRNATGMRVP